MGFPRMRVGNRSGRIAAAASLPAISIEKRWAADDMQVDVIQDRDSTCHALMSARVEADPHRIFTLFERDDYDNIFEIFKVIKLYEILEDNGDGRKLINLHVDAQWSFWKVSGDCFIPISMQMDRAKGEISFFQKYPGFLTEYKGQWTIMGLDEEGRPANSLVAPRRVNGGTERSSLDGGESSLVSLELTVKPSIIPPPPINRLLNGNTTDQMSSLFRDLKAELSKESPLDVDTILRGAC